MCHSEAVAGQQHTVSGLMAESTELGRNEVLCSTGAWDSESRIGAKSITANQGHINRKGMWWDLVLNCPLYKGSSHNINNSLASRNIVFIWMRNSRAPNQYELPAGRCGMSARKCELPTVGQSIPAGRCASWQLDRYLWLVGKRFSERQLAGSTVLGISCLEGSLWKTWDIFISQLDHLLQY